MEAPAGYLEYNTRRVSQFCWGPVAEKETDKSCRGQFLNSTQYLVSEAKKKKKKKKRTTCYKVWCAGFSLFLHLDGGH